VTRSSLKAGLSFQEYVSCDNDVVTCEVQTLEQMMGDEPTSGMSEEGRQEVGLQQHFCWHWRVAALRKYIMFGVLMTG